jgi:hypothetical protein
MTPKPHRQLSPSVLPHSEGHTRPAPWTGSTRTAGRRRAPPPPAPPWPPRWPSARRRTATPWSLPGSRGNAVLTGAGAEAQPSSLLGFSVTSGQTRPPPGPAAILPVQREARPTHPDVPTPPSPNTRAADVHSPTRADVLPSEPPPAPLVTSHRHTRQGTGTAALGEAVIQCGQRLSIRKKPKALTPPPMYPASAGPDHKCPQP